MADLHILRQRMERRQPIQVVAANGTIDIHDGIVMITKGTAAAVTLAAPSGKDEGKTLIIISTTAAAHTLTIAGGLNGGGVGADVGTFGGAIGDGVTLVAYNGIWYGLPSGNLNVTFA